MIINKNFEYKEDEFIYFIREETGKVQVIQTKKGERRIREKSMREVPFSDIVSMNLNKRGKSIPFSSNGVISVNRYLFHYWTPIMGADVVSLYILLTEYCDDETDICFPKEKELADRLGVTRPTIRTKLGVLEENNFIIVVNRLNKLKENAETSPIYKIRQTIPMLSREQYLELPDYLKEKHDAFMTKYANGDRLDFLSYDSTQTYSSLLKNSERMVTKKDKRKIDAILENSQQSEYILVNLSPTQQLFSEKVREAIQKNWSKPSYETLFSDSITVFNQETNVVDFVLNELAKDMMKETPSYKDRLLTIFSQVLDAPIKKYYTYSFKEYIIRLERLK